MLSVTITASSQSMVVYILTDQQLTEWKNQQHCDPRTSGIGIELVQGSDPNDLLQQAIIDWTAPASGHYSILVEVFSGAPVTVTAAPTETNAETLYQTGYNTGITTISQTYQTLEPVSSFPQDTALILIAVIVALAIGGYLAFRLKKGKPELPHPLESPAPTNLETQKVTDKQFCTECGTSLPMGSKFCNKCGSKQE
jgi:ribosomal protein L40E